MTHRITNYIKLFFNYPNCKTTFSGWFLQKFSILFCFINTFPFFSNYITNLNILVKLIVKRNEQEGRYVNIN